MVIVSHRGRNRRKKKKEKTKNWGRKESVLSLISNRKRNRMFMESGAMQCSPGISERIPNTRGRALLYY